ncbi:MAG: conjugal transfer protein TraX, partial [Clostridia bacterium]|nr:conjugal transfer protein TraX [Clostridia bacterium]
MNKLRFLSGNSIKILAALAMVIDHVGLLFFPFDPVFRMIGRLAFPLFAYMIAEGCKY